MREGRRYPIDTLRRAILQVRKAEYQASGIVPSPVGIVDLELTTDACGNSIVVIHVVEGGQNAGGACRSCPRL
jgi:hypothetical protein